MAFTSTDLTNIEAAIIDLATGAREVQVAVGDRSIRYAECDMDKLQALRSIVQAQVGTVYTRVYAYNGGRSS
jgi:hypothetical protein